MAAPWWSDATDASGVARVAGARAPRDAGVAVRDVGRHRALDAAALLRLLPGVGEDADRAREEEDAAPERGREAELGIDHRGRAVDVHRDRGALRALEQPLDRARVAREAPADDARRCRLVDQLQQPDRARIDAVPAVAEAGNDLATLRDPALERAGDDVVAAVGVAGGDIDLAQQLHALLAGAAVDVVEDVDRRGDGA